MLIIRWRCINVNSVDAEALGRWCLIDTGNRTILRVLRRGYAKGKFNLDGARIGSHEADASVSMATPVLWIKCVS
jgi:hypothetical protein